jgi:hypothetical protein
MASPTGSIVASVSIRFTLSNGRRRAARHLYRGGVHSWNSGILGELAAVLDGASAVAPFGNWCQISFCRRGLTKFRSVTPAENVAAD